MWLMRNAGLAMAANECQAVLWAGVGRWPVSCSRQATSPPGCWITQVSGARCRPRKYWALNVRNRAPCCFLKTVKNLSPWCFALLRFQGTWDSRSAAKPGDSQAGPSGFPCLRLRDLEHLGPCDLPFLQQGPGTSQNLAMGREGLRDKGIYLSSFRGRAALWVPDILSLNRLLLFKIAFFKKKKAFFLGSSSRPAMWRLGN